jgi:mannose-6-phosphate isomerase
MCPAYPTPGATGRARVAGVQTSDPSRPWCEAAGPNWCPPGRRWRSIGGLHDQAEGGVCPAAGRCGKIGPVDALDPGGARRVEKPWGYEIWYAVTEKYAGKILHVDQGHRLSLQFHKRKDESCYLLTGRLLLIKGPTADELRQETIGPGQTWRNHPGEVHTIEALEDSDVLEVSTPHLDDVVRLHDDYGREGTSRP